jgi:hypothetical protein
MPGYPKIGATIQNDVKKLGYPKIAEPLKQNWN